MTKDSGSCGSRMGRCLGPAQKHPQARSFPAQTLTLSDLKPCSQPRSGGTQVTITGTNLNEAATWW